MVDTWYEYDTMIADLIKTGKFEKTRITHRLNYDGKLDMDLIPFGAIAGTDKLLKWPPDGLTAMLMLGFDEVFDNSITMEYGPGKNIRIASLEGMTILKLIALADRYRQKDAQDLGVIITNSFGAYLNAGEYDAAAGNIGD